MLDLGGEALCLQLANAVEGALLVATEDSGCTGHGMQDSEWGVWAPGF